VSTNPGQAHGLSIGRVLRCAPAQGSIRMDVYFGLAGSVLARGLRIFETARDARNLLLARHPARCAGPPRKKRRGSRHFRAQGFAPPVAENPAGLERDPTEPRARRPARMRRPSRRGARRRCREPSSSMVARAATRASPPSRCPASAGASPWRRGLRASSRSTSPRRRRLGAAPLLGPWPIAVDPALRVFPAPAFRQHRGHR
jgi:hypothetical protein